MNSPCDRLNAQKDAYLSGELPEKARLEFESHLQNCPRCTAELEGAKRLRQRLRAAVSATPAPSGLEAMVRRTVRAQPARPRTGLYAVAAAAAIVLCMYVVGVLRMNRNPEDAILSMNAGRLSAVLSVGLRDHLHCAVFRKYSREPLPAAEMAADLGPQFAGLLPLVQSKLPSGFRVVQAHHCTAGGRRYTHFIIAGGGKLMSLILTPAQPGESLSGGIHQTGVDRYQVVAFESRGELAFVISDMEAPQNLQSAVNLAPTVRQYLAEHPS